MADGGLTAFFISLAVSAATSGVSFVAQRLFTPQPKTLQRGKYEGDLFVQNSAYGQIIPRIYGANPTDNKGGGLVIAGNVIWTSGIRKKTEKTSGGKGPRRPATEDITYDVDLAVMLGLGPLKVTKIWANTTLIYNEDHSEASSGVSGVYDPDAAPDTDYNQFLPPNPNGDYSIDRYDSVTTPDAQGVISLTTNSGNFASVTIYPGNSEQLQDPLIQADVDGARGANSTPAYRGRCYVVFEKFNLTKFGNAVPNFTFQVEHKTIKTLDAICEELCRSVGIADTDFNFTELASVEVRGFVQATRQSPKTMLESLGRVYASDFYESDGIVRGTPLATESVAMISADDLGVQEGQPTTETNDTLPLIDSTLIDEPQLPRQIEIKFYDPRRDGQSNTQRETRQVTRSEKTETIDVPNTLIPREARQLAQRELYKAWLERNQFALALGWKYCYLKPTDVVTVEANGFTYFVRIREIRGTAPAPLQFLGVAQEISVFNPAGLGDGGDGYEPFPVNTPPQSIATLFNLPNLRPGDSELGYYAACAARGPGTWEGAALYKDMGLGFEKIAEWGNQATMGVAVGALGNFTGTGTDSTNTVTVDLYFGSLASASGGDLDAGANLAILGNEVIQWETATQVSGFPRRFTLSNLRRGQRGTSDQVGSHIAGERFSLIDTAVVFVATLASEAGIERTYKAVTVGQNVDDAASFTFTWTGNPNGQGNTDTDVPNIAKITEGKVLDRKRLPDDKVQSVLVVRIPNRLTDLEANAASIDAAEITVYDRFLTLILEARLYPFQGDGVAAQISHVRKFADPIGFKDVAQVPYNVPEAIYKIRLRNKFGFSQPIWIIGETFRTTQPAATDPSSYLIKNLVANPSSASTVDLTWEYSGTDPVNVTWYVVTNDRQPTASASGTITTAGAQSFQVTGLLPNTTYDFRVNPAGVETFSNITSAKTFEGLGNVVIEQAAPSSLAAAQLNSTSNVRLTWTANTTQNTGVQIWRKTGSGGTYAQIATAGVVTEYVDGTTATSTIYYYKIKNVYAAGVSAFSNEVNITTSAFYPAPVTSTQSGKGDVSGSTEARFCWYPTGTGQTGFEIYRNGSLVATVPGSQFYYNDSGLSPSTSYNHQVRAKFGSDSSDFSAQTTANTTEASGTRAAPTNLAAVAVSATQIDITWTRNSSTNTSTNCIVVHRDGFIDPALSSPSATSFSITGLTADTDYTILLVHYYASSKTSVYAVTTCRTLTAGGTGGGLAAPTSFTATGASSSQINLAWTDSTTGSPLRTEIWRGLQTATMAPIITVNVGTTSYSDTGLNSGTQYFYKIRHEYAGSTFSDFTAIAQATTTAATYPAPSSLTATPFSSSQINLAWTANTTSATGVQVYRNGALLTTLSGSATSYNDTGLSANTTYTYQIRNAFTGGNFSNYSNTAQATTQGGVQFQAPQNLVALAQSEFSVSLTWTRNSTTNTGATIYRNGFFLATVGASTVAYTDNACNAATTYTYKVLNNYSAGDSAFSNESTVTTPANSAFPAPTGLSVAAASDTALDLTWTRNSTTNIAVEVWQALSPSSSTYFLVTTLAATITSFQQTGLSPGTTYKFQVRNVYSGGNYSAYSSSANGTTSSSGTFPAPTGLSGTTAPGQVQLNWTRNSTTNTGVEVYRSEIGGSNRTLLSTLGATTVTYTDSAGVVGIRYYYSVRNVYTGPNYSAEIATDGIDFPSTLPAPSNLAVTGFTGTVVSLGWTRNTTANTETRLARTGIAGELILDPTRTTFDDTSVLPGNTYLYKLRHNYGNGQFSAYSNEVSVTTPAGSYPAPQSLTAQATSPTSVVLAWQFGFSSNTGFEIYRNGSYYQTVGSSATNYTDTSVTANTSYTYKIRATFTGPNFSAFSNEVTVTTPTDQYPPPLNLQYNQVTSESVHLFWQRNSSTNLNTQVFQDGVNLGNFGAATTDIVITGLSPNTDYVFKVRHRYGSGIFSADSNSVFVTTDVLVLL